MKKNYFNKKLVLFIALLLIFAVVFSACSSSSTQTEKKAEEKGDVKVNLDEKKIVAEGKDGKETFQVGEEMDWPKEIPDYVPKFTYGKILGMEKFEMNNQNGFFVLIENLDEKAGENYKKDLESAGYKITDYTKMDKGQLVFGENDKLTIAVSCVY